MFLRRISKFRIFKRSFASVIPRNLCNPKVGNGESSSNDLKRTLEERFKIPEERILESIREYKSVEVNESFESFEGSMNDGFQKLFKELEILNESLGLSLGSKAANFLKKLVKDEMGNRNPKVINGYKFKVPGKKIERRIDVISIEPRIVLGTECVLCKKKGIKKLEKLVETRADLEKDGIPCLRTYIVYHTIDSRIEDKCEAFMKEHNIIPLESCDL